MLKNQSFCFCLKNKFIKFTEMQEYNIFFYISYHRPPRSPNKTAFINNRNKPGTRGKASNGIQDHYADKGINRTREDVETFILLESLK